MTNTLEQIRGRLQGREFDTLKQESFRPDRRRSLASIKHRLGVELNDKERESFTREFQVLSDVHPPSELFREPIKDESDPTIGKEVLKSYIRGSLGIPKTAGTSIEKVGVALQTEGVKGGSTRFKRPEFFGSELASKAGKFLENTGSSIRKFFGNIAEEYESNYLKDKKQLSFNMLKDPMFYASTLPETAVSMIPSLLVGGTAFKTTQILGKTFKLTPEIIRKMAMINAAIAGGFVGGELESANTYEEALGQGKSEQEAAKLSNMMTLASGALNALSFAKIFSKAGAGIAGKIVKFLGSSATEGTTEWAEEPAEALILGKDIKEAMKQGTIVIPAAAIMGGSASLTIGDEAAESVTKDVEPQVEEGIVTEEDKLQRGVEEIQEKDIVIDEEVLNELDRQQKVTETPVNSLDEIKARLLKNVIPEEGKGTGEAFRPTLEKEAIVPRETIAEVTGVQEETGLKETVPAETAAIETPVNLKKGVPISEKPSTRAPTIKQLANKAKTRGGIITGKVNGEDFYSDGSILIKGIPVKDIEISKSKPNFEEVIPSATLEEIKPVGYQIIDDIGIVWLDNKQTIGVKYYDYIKKKYPGVIFKSTGGENNAIKLYNKDEFVGVLMPTAHGAVMPELQAETLPPEKTTDEERHAGLNLFKLIPKKYRDAFRQFFNPFILLSKESEVLFERSKARGAVKRTEDFITKTKKKIDVHPLEVRKDIFRYLDDTIDITDLPENARGLAISIRNAQMRIGRALVKRGLLKKEAFESLKGKYVHYIYARHIIGEGIEVDASKLVTPTGKLNMTYLISRNPSLTHEDRISLGLIEDAGIAVPVGMGKALIDIAKFDYLDRLTDPELDIIWKPSTVKVGNKRWGISKLAKEVQAQSNLVTTNTKNGIENKPAIERLRILGDALEKAKEKMGAEPKDFRQIPDSVKFGNLAGAFIRTPVYNDIMPLVTPLSSNAGVGRLFQAFAKFNSQVTGLFKAGKVALNPPTMFRNTISNLLQNNMRGRMLSLIPKDMIMALKGMIDKDSDFITAKRNGLFESNFAAAELNEVLKELNEVNISHWDSFLTFIGNISKYYGKIDDVAKFTIYKQLRTSGKLNRLGIGDGVPTPIEYAILEAQKWGMDYSLASRSVKHLRRHIIPFSTYQYKIAPLILESLEKRPWVIGKFVALLGVGSFSIAQILVKDYFDVDDDEWERLLKQLPHYIKANKTFVPLPWKSPEGEWQWVNGEYFMPWGTWSTIARDVKGGEIFEAFKSVGVGNPILSVFQVLQSGSRDKPPVDSFTKQPLWNQLDEPREKYLKLFSWLTNLVAPSVLENIAVKDAPKQGALGTTIRSVKSKITGEPERDKWGRTLTLGQSIGKWFGFNITTISPKQTAVIKYARIKNLQKELIKKYTDPRISKDSKTLEKARKNFMEEMNKIRENQ